MPQNEEATKWLKSASDDLETAEAIVAEKAPAWAACFHCQQTAEKSLKAAQIYFLNDFSKEHDLKILLDSLGNHCEIKKIKNEIIELTDYYVTTRYPGMKEYEIKISDAQTAIIAAKKIFDFVKKLLK